MTEGWNRMASEFEPPLQDDAQLLPTHQCYFCDKPEIEFCLSCQKCADRYLYGYVILKHLGLAAIGFVAATILLRLFR